MLGLGASRFPRVSFKTERPFIIGSVITFGLITWLHNKLYRDGKVWMPTSSKLTHDPDPFIFKDPNTTEAPSH